MSGRSDLTEDEVPEVVVLRLPQYVRALADLLRRNVQVVSSQQLGASFR